MVAANDYLALKPLAKLVLQEPRWPTALITRANDKQPTLAITGHCGRGRHRHDKRRRQRVGGEGRVELDDGTLRTQARLVASGERS